MEILIQIDMAHHIFCLNPPVKLAIHFLFVHKILINHAAIPVQAFIGSLSDLYYYRFYFCQQPLIAQRQRRFMNQPRGFNIMSVRDNMILI